MSAVYDAHKAEAWRILATPELVKALIKDRVGKLKCPYPMVGCAKCDTINENHYKTPEKLVMTVAGHCTLVYNSPMSTREQHQGHNRWLVRKLKELGRDIESACTRVSTCNGSVYFSYHLIIKQDSHLVDR
jgi:hypothetical protein